MTKKVLVLIVNYNGSAYIGDCLSSLTAIKTNRCAYEILVVDNASTDASLRIIKDNFPEVKIIENKNNNGFAGGNNSGFAYARAYGFDYVYLLNQDTEVDPHFLDAVVEMMESDNRIGAVQSKLLLFEQKNLINSWGNEIHFLGFAYAGGYRMPDVHITPREITYPSGAAVLISVAALRTVGFFNERFFMYHEDTDLGWRLWLAGYRIVLAPDSIVYHKYEFSRSIKKFYYMERNRILMVLQNYKSATLLLILPAWIAMQIAMCGYAFIGGWWKEYFKAGAYFLRPGVWKEILKTRREIQRLRTIKDKTVVGKFTGVIAFQDINNPLLRYVVNPVCNGYWQIVKRLIWW